jgi:hypothetical protein
MKKTITLTIFERIQLASRLPNDLKYEMGDACKSLRRKLAITDEEKKQINYRETSDGNGNISITWNENMEQPFKVTLTQVEFLVIQLILPDERLLALWEKFKKH